MIRDRLFLHFLDQRFEVAQGGDGASGVAVEPGDVLAGAAEQQTGHLIDVLGFGRFGLLDKGSLVGPEGLANLDVSALVLIVGEAEPKQTSRLEFPQIGEEGTARLA